MSTTFATPLNNVTSTLASSYAAASGTVAVAAGDGALFGAISPSAPVRFTLIKRSALGLTGEIADRAGVSIYLATGRTGDTLTGVTVQEGTTDQAFAAGDLIGVLVTAGTIGDLQSAVNARTAWSTGAGAPSSGAGSDGDFYYDTTGHVLYQKIAGAWDSGRYGPTPFAGALFYDDGSGDVAEDSRLAWDAANDRLVVGGDVLATTPTQALGTDTGQLASCSFVLANAVAGAGGTVSTVSVASAHGFSGTVATATTTPAITLGTTITGLLKGNGTAISAATAGTDYLAPAGNGSSLTGITESQVANLTTDLAAKAPLASPALTGTPTAPTATVGTNTTQLATTAFVLANAGGTPGGSTGSVQYDSSGSFAGDSSLTWDPAGKKLTLGGTVALDSFVNVFRIYCGGQRVDYNENVGVGLDINNLAGNLRWYAGAGAIVFRTRTLVGNEQATTEVPLTVKGVASQSAALTEWRDASGTLLAAVSAAGGLATIRSVSYAWPTSQGASSTFLQNDGSGNLSWAAGAGGGSGTVTSVALALPAFLTVSGSPVTTSGTLTAALATQAANLVFAGPTTGAAAAPTFRALVAADLPATYLTGNQTITLSGDVSGSGATAITTTIGAAKVTNAMLAGSIAASKLIGSDIATVGTITAGTWTGTTVAIANGGTGQTTAIAAYNATCPTTTLGDLAVRDTSGNVRLAGNATGTKKFLTQTGTGSLSALPAWSTVAAADLPTTGLQVNSHYGTITADADGATITFDCGAADWHSVTLGGSRTLALTGDVDGQQFSLILKQDATGSRTVTWWSGILWPGGTTPTLTTTPNKRDIFTFKRLSSGVYLGFVAGLNF